MVQHLSIFAWVVPISTGWWIAYKPSWRLSLSEGTVGCKHFGLTWHDSCDFWSPRGASCLVKQLGKKYAHRIKANHRVNQSTSDVICFVPKKSRGFGEIYSKKMLKLIAKGDARKNQRMLWRLLSGTCLWMGYPYCGLSQGPDRALATWHVHGQSIYSPCGVYVHIISYPCSTRA